MTTQAELQATVDDSKPRPKANLEATALADVYSIELLVGKDMLRQLPIREWEERIQENREVLMKSRFVSKRIEQVVKGGDIKKIKLLRYMLILLDFFSALKGTSREGRKVLPNKDLVPLLGVSEGIVSQIRKRFVEDGGYIHMLLANQNVCLLILRSLMNKWHIDNLITHLAAMACVIDEFNIDTYELKEDLRLDTKQSVPFQN